MKPRARVHRERRTRWLSRRPVRVLDRVADPAVDVLRGRRQRQLGLGQRLQPVNPGLDVGGRSAVSVAPPRQPSQNPVCDHLVIHICHTTESTETCAPEQRKNRIPVARTFPEAGGASVDGGGRLCVLLSHESGSWIVLQIQSRTHGGTGAKGSWVSDNVFSQSTQVLTAAGGGPHLSCRLVNRARTQSAIIWSSTFAIPRNLQRHRHRSNGSVWPAARRMFRMRRSPGVSDARPIRRSA